MSQVCQFCGDGSVVSVDLDDGRTDMVCVECGSVAKPISTSLRQLPGVAVDNSLEEPVTTESVCQSCGETLQSTETIHCSDCRELEGEEENNEINSQNQSAANGEVSSKNSLHKQPEDPKIVKPSNMCLSCKGTDLVVDNLGTEERLVCRNCGKVVEGEVFRYDGIESTLTRTFGNDFKKVPKFSNITNRDDCKGFRAGISKISLLKEMLILPEVVLKGAEDMFKRAFYRPCFLNTTIRKKEHIGAVCVFLACRSHEIPISMVHFTDYVDSMRLFTKCFKQIKQELDIQTSHPTLSKQINDTLYSLNSEAINFNTGKISAQVRDLLFLCRRSWITTGCLCQPYILWAIYYTYLNANKSLRYMTFAKFRKSYKLPAPRGRDFGHKFPDLMLKLANGLPWVKEGEVKRTNIHHYIDDILRYKNSLIRLTFEDPEPGKECARWEGALSSSNSNNDKQLKRVLLPESFVNGRNREKTLVPRHEVRIPDHIDLDSTEIRPSEFSEKEISSYLMSSKEQDSLKKAKESLITHGIDTEKVHEPSSVKKRKVI